jgi:hypothetical protein
MEAQVKLEKAIGQSIAVGGGIEDTLNILAKAIEDIQEMVSHSKQTKEDVYLLH